MEIDGDYGLVEAKDACAYSFRFGSLTGSDLIALVEADAEKLKDLKTSLLNMSEKTFDKCPVQSVNVQK